MKNILSALMLAGTSLAAPAFPNGVKLRTMRNASLRSSYKIVLTVLMLTIGLNPAYAATVSGTVASVEGHISPACRVLVIKNGVSGGSEYYRIPDTGTDNSILAVALTAIATNQQVVLTYTSGVTTGCGTEPRIEYLRLSRP